MNRTILRIACRVLLASMFLVLAGCKENHESAARQSDALPTVTARVEKLELQPVTLPEEVVGTVRAKLRATLEAKQSGRIEKLLVALGDTVRAGDLVAELDAAETAARLDQAEAALEQADRDWKRVATLFEARSATLAERDAVEARLRVAKGAVAETKALLSHARIVAPFDGVVTRKWADAGDLATPGKPLVDVENLSALQVEIDIPEGLANSVSKNKELVVVGNSGAKCAAIATELTPALDPLTRTRKAKLELKQGSQFAPGQFVRVLIPLAERQAMLLPKQAVVERGQLQMVFTLENQHARMHLVKTRPHSDGRVEILSGLRPGDRVVVEGVEPLVDGQPLEAR